MSGLRQFSSTTPTAYSLKRGKDVTDKEENGIMKKKREAQNCNLSIMPFSIDSTSPPVLTVKLVVSGGEVR